ncbi:MAG: hypothetical protein M1833_002079 [Piccolia ochrophora]|nr:MAG: hypothetical protein M1833_002079 [Piccolia ochrophora]
MNESGQIASSLLTEHLRYTPLALIDDIINSINALLYRAVAAVENGLLNTPPPSLGFGRQRPSHADAIPETDGDGNILYPDAKAEIDEGVQKLETLLEATVDKNFDKLEIYALRNVLTVPEDVVRWVRLPHYENLNLNIPSDHPTPSSLNSQRRKLHETQKLHRLLLAESTRNELLLTQLHSLLSPPTSSSPSKSTITPPNPSPFTLLTAPPASQILSLSLTPQTTQAHPPSNPPLTTTIGFTTSQLPALRSLLSELRPKLASLSHPSPTAGPPGVSTHDTAQDARTHYINSQVRRHLTDTRGLELDERGGVRDGEWQGGGRKVGGEEVADMEGVVGLLGGDEEGDEEDEGRERRK